SASRGTSAAREGADHAVSAADRAARVADTAEDELDDAGARWARRVQASSERIAVKVDDTVIGLARAARPFNPVRVAGRVAAGTVTAAFGLSGAVVSRTGRAAQRTTRGTAGRS
ncbi:MAG: hypothetical protein M3235_08110, partial [Actinomycetota bacterium]|nr:hypothetical protein [Actinomycetota bacterium]